MPEHNEFFTPDEVDEQIEQCSYSRNSHQIQESSQSSVELVQQLRLLVTAQILQPIPPGGFFTAKFDLGFTTQPVVANGVVYVASRTGKVYALDFGLFLSMLVRW